MNRLSFRRVVINRKTFVVRAWWVFYWMTTNFYPTPFWFLFNLFLINTRVLFKVFSRHEELGVTVYFGSHAFLCRTTENIRRVTRFFYKKHYEKLGWNWVLDKNRGKYCELQTACIMIVRGPHRIDKKRFWSKQGRQKSV